MRASALTLIALGLAAPLRSQDAKPPRYAQPMPMYSNRAEDSYAIYSQLLEGGPNERRDVKSVQLLVEDTTNAIPLDDPCHEAPIDISMNPHEAVEAPADRQVEWKEVLVDYDQHCHDVIQLERDKFKTELPVHLLNASDKRVFVRDRRKPPSEFAGGAGLLRFTEVFFNTNHTLALVEHGMWCGPLCGYWTWVVLEHRQGRWETLPWVNAFSIS